MVNVIITDAGIAEIVNAENNGTAPVILSEIALGTGKYTPAASQTALQAEFKRITNISGGNAGDNIIHLSMLDESSDSYTVYEVGVFTDKGTLFAVCSQNTPILQKAAVSRAGLSLDIALTNINPESVTFGDTNFLLNSATTEQQGIIELATEAEAKAGTDTHRAVTPKALDATIEGHDNIVHRSGGETISGSKTFTRDITVNAPATSAPTGVKINDTNGKGTGYLAQYYAGNEYYTRVMCKNNTSGKSAHIDVKINDDGTSMFFPSVDVMCAPSVPESDKSANVATTEWVSNKVAKYLPLTGGTISGTIFTSGSGSPVLSVKKGNLNGGRIFLFAPNDADFLGGIVLRAYNSDNTRFVDLTIKSDNTMTWNGKNIVRSVNNVNADTAGNVTITTVSGNAGTATKLQTARTITLAGDLSGSTTFDGSGNVSITATVKDDSHNHVISNVDGLQSALDGKAASSHTHSISNVSGLQSALDGKLSLAGGTMTGTISSSASVLAKKTTDDSILYLYGASEYNKGACLVLSGGKNAENGSFMLAAADEITDGWRILKGSIDGTLTWDGKYVLNNSFMMPVDTGAIMMNAGTTATGGAYFRLYGKGHTSGAGQFNIAATNGTATKALTGKPDGSLTWDGKSVVCVTSWRSGANWYRKYSDGFIEQGGALTSGVDGNRTVTLHTPFTTNTYFAVAQSVYTEATGHGWDYVSSKTTTSFVMSVCEGSPTWYACGY